MSDPAIQVLLVEDNPGDARLLEEALATARTPCRVRHVVSLGDALRLVGASAPDVVLLDLQLPDSAGMDTVRKMRQAAPRLPIVVLTGLADEDVGLESLREGAQDYLIKGQTDSVLLSRCLAYAIERNRADQQRQQLVEELRQSQELLEQRVRERTSELESAIGLLGQEIKERRLAEEELRQREQRLRTVVSSAPIILWALDPQGNVTMIEGQALKRMGIEVDRLASQGALDSLRRGNPQLPRLLRKAMAGEEARAILHFAGRSLDTRYNALRSADGQPVGMIGVSMDVTERLQAQEQIHCANRALRVLSESGEALIRATDEPDLLRQMCKKLVEIGGYRLAWVCWRAEMAPDSPDSASGPQDTVVQAGLTTQRARNHPWLTACGAGPTAAALQSGQPVTVRDLPTHGGFTAWRGEAAQLGVNCVIALPLAMEGKTLGVLTICSADTDAFDPQEVALLGDLANDIAFGLTAMRTRREAQEAQAALVRQAQVMDAFFEHTATPLAFLDRNLRFLEVNDAYARAFSRDTGQLRGTSLTDLLPAPLGKLLKQAARERRILVEQARPLTLDSHPEWGPTYWDMALVPILDASGKLDSLVYSLHDVTQRKRHEERVLATNMLLELFTLRGNRKEYLDGLAEMVRQWAACSSVGIRLVDKEQRIPYEASLGFPARLARGESAWRLEDGSCVCARVIAGKSDPQDRPFMTPRGAYVCNDLQAVKRSLAGSPKARCPEGCAQTGFATVAVFPLRYREQTLGALHVADRQVGKIAPDLLEFLEVISPLVGEALHRFEVEEALRVSEEHFRSMIESSQDRISLLSCDGRFLSMNQAGCELVGLAHPSELIGKRAIAGIVENVEGFDLAMSLACQGETAAVQYKSTGGRGRETWWDAKLTPIRDGGGQVVSVLLVARDATERKRLEREVVEIGSQERWSVGQDLHESLGQHLTGITFLCKGLQQRLQARNLPEAAEAGELSTLVNKAINQTRMLARGLCPVQPKAEGLISALRELAEGVETAYGLSCVLRHDPSLTVADDYKATQLYLIAQEALNNAVKHGKARKIVARLVRRGEKLQLVVEHDGAADGGSRPGLDLRMMHYRAGMIGATLTVARAGTRGTRMTCVVSAPPRAVRAES